MASRLPVGSCVIDTHREHWIAELPLHPTCPAGMHWRAVAFQFWEPWITVLWSMMAEWGTQLTGEETIHARQKFWIGQPPWRNACPGFQWKIVGHRVLFPYIRILWSILPQGVGIAVVIHDDEVSSRVRESSLNASDARPADDLDATRTAYDPDASSGSGEVSSCSKSKAEAKARPGRRRWPKAIRCTDSDW